MTARCCFPRRRPTITSTHADLRYAAFACDRSDREGLARDVVRMSDLVAARLRSSRKVARTVQLKLRYRDFSTITRAHTLPGPTDLAVTIAAEANVLLDAVDLRDGIRLLGVTATGPEEAGAVQEQLDFGASSAGGGAGPVGTAGSDALERTLDDSSNRRLVLPEAFLALDGALDIMANVAEGLVVWEATVAANLAAELPFMASENIMLAATKAGADRQEAHEVIRVHSMAAAEEVKRFGRPNDLMARLKRDPYFARVDLEGALDPSAFIGRAPEHATLRAASSTTSWPPTRGSSAT